jgi:hypothetical protein
VILDGSQLGASSTVGAQNSTNVVSSLNAVLLIGTLHAKLSEGRKKEVIDDYLQKVQFLSSRFAKEAQNLVTAGIVPTVILLLKAHTVDSVGLKVVLVTLGILM